MKIVCLEDFKINAKNKLPIESFHYIDSGSDEQVTKKEN